MKDKSTTIITSLEDSRLIKIDPNEENFWDILNFDATVKKEAEVLEMINLNYIAQFLEKLPEVKKSNVDAFYVPIFAPSIVGKKTSHRITFKKDKQPAVGMTLKWWKETIENIPAVENRTWSLAKVNQFFVYMVWLVNKLKKEGMSMYDALVTVAGDATLFSLHMVYNIFHTPIFPKTGEKSIAGVYDVEGMSRILALPNDEKKFCLSGDGKHYNVLGTVSSIKDRLTNVTESECILSGINGVALLVL